MGGKAQKSRRTRPYIQKVPVAKNPNKKAKKRRSRKLITYLTIPEKDRLFQAIKSVRDRAIFRMLYHHGLRASEIGKLVMTDYRPGSKLELDRMYIRRLKGSMSGEHALIPAAATAIRAWVKQRGHKDGPLFPSRLRSPISRKHLFTLMRKYCAIAGIPREKAHPHCLKHTCCTHLVSDQRESIMDVKTHVGHVAIQSTMQYANLSDEANEARAKRLRGWR
jgi:integrase